MTIDPIPRVRQICLTLPETSEKISHGEPTFFVRNRVFVMVASNYYKNERITVWLPVPPGLQSALIEESPQIFFMPPYVGGRGWVGIELARIDDLDLEFHIRVAWDLIMGKQRNVAHKRAKKHPG